MQETRVHLSVATFLLASLGNLRFYPDVYTPLLNLTSGAHRLLTGRIFVLFFQSRYGVRGLFNV